MARRCQCSRSAGSCWTTRSAGTHLTAHICMHSLRLPAHLHNKCPGSTSRPAHKLYTLAWAPATLPLRRVHTFGPPLKLLFLLCGVVRLVIQARVVGALACRVLRHSPSGSRAGTSGRQVTAVQIEGTGAARHLQAASAVFQQLVAMVDWSDTAAGAGGVLSWPAGGEGSHPLGEQLGTGSQSMQQTCSQPLAAGQGMLQLCLYGCKTSTAGIALTLMQKP